ncbi:Flp pilus assembly protein CpaB, partial [Neisseria gonorrhoeae]|uniref:Flp pilus assembly protein CpaB n=1 Tax=Neisseria gonorrhoeae TaxID=485 RepID=UPI001B7FD57C
GAGGFILPNDRVDVILSKRDKNPDKPGGPDYVSSEIILSNVRVLAIDQAPKEKEGQNTVVGKTVTLELKPEQAETLARMVAEDIYQAGFESIRSHLKQAA